MLRFGIVGTNWITDRLLEAASHIEEFSLKAIYSRTAERANEFAKKYNVESTYTDLEEMAKSDQIDAVYIASPNSFHMNQAITFMENGKHVLCEKPMASNTKELQAMIDVAKRNNVLLMEALKTTLLPNFMRIKENLHKIGKVRRYAASFCQYSSRYDTYRNGTVLNAFNPVFSNGSLMDLGVYCLYPMVALFGEPHGIKATSVMLDSGVDGAGSLLLQYDGMEAVISHSKITSSSAPSEIQGEDGSIYITKISDLAHIEIRYHDGTVEEINRPADKPTMYYELREFIELVHNGKTESSVNSYNNSLVTIKVVEEARKQFGLYYPADQ